MDRPKQVDEITPAWLTHALRSGGADVEVESVEIVDVTSSTSKIFIRATYGTTPSPAGTHRLIWW